MDIWIVIAYMAVLIFYGIKTGKNIHTLEDFLLPGSRIGLFALTASLTAAAVGGGFSTGNASEVFKHGVTNIYALFGFSVGQILIGSVFLKRTRTFEGLTSPGEVLKRAYGKGGQLLTGVSTVLLSAGVLGAQLAAVGGVFNMLLGIPFQMGVLIGLFVILVYSTFGGMGAVIKAEVFQFVILAVGLVFLLVFSLRAAGGAGTMLLSVPPEHLTLFGDRGPVAFLSLFLTMMIGEALQPATVQRFLSGKDRKTASRAATFAGLLTIPIFVITGTAGLAARAMMPALSPELALPAVILTVLPVGLRGLVIAAMLAIVMSSADAVLASASIGIVSDILAPLGIVKKGRQGLTAVRAANVLTGVLGLLFVLFGGDVFSILVLSYAFWCPVVLVPMGAAMLGRRVKKPLFYFAAAAGAMASIFWSAMGEPFGVSSMIAGFFVHLILFVGLGWDDLRAETPTGAGALLKSARPRRR